LTKVKQLVERIESFGTVNPAAPTVLDHESLCHLSYATDWHETRVAGQSGRKKTNLDVNNDRVALTAASLNLLSCQYAAVEKFTDVLSVAGDSPEFVGGSRRAGAH